MRTKNLIRRPEFPRTQIVHKVTEFDVYTTPNWPIIRPVSLKDIFCQDRAVGTLERAFGAGRVPHAYIFAGLEGVGKFTTASQWAKLLLCEKPTQHAAAGIEFDSCGKCLSCINFDVGSHPDFAQIYKELVQFTEKGKGKTTPIDMPIDVIREFLINKVASKPTLSQRTVYVVEEGQKLNRESQNALLKVLEEPPPFCSIILLCTRLEELLPTTQSRCQIVNFGPIDEDVIIEKLRLNGIGTDEARYWARFSQGSLGAALRWSAVKSEEVSVFAIKKELIERLVRYELADAVDFAEWIGRQTKTIGEVWQKVEKDTSAKDLGRRATNGVLTMIMGALNDVMELNVGIGEKLINEDQRRQISELAKKYDVETAADGIASVYKSMDWLDAAVNEKLIFDELLLNLTAKAII
jgi:DNA polymerase-3 subunit delta'